MPNAHDAVTHVTPPNPVTLWTLEEARLEADTLAFWLDLLASLPLDATMLPLTCWQCGGLLVTETTTCPQCQCHIEPFEGVPDDRR